MIIVNGMPKNGTHALMALLSGQGWQRRPGTLLSSPDGLRCVGCALESVKQDEHRPGLYMLAHVPADRELWGHIVTVFRDPRNVLVSYCRHRERVDCERVTIPQAIESFWGHPFVPTYDAYLGWYGRSLCLRYEELGNIGDGKAIYANHAHDWNTYTGSPSQWHLVWDDAAETAWQRAGGPELLERAGYN